MIQKSAYANKTTPTFRSSEQVSVSRSDLRQGLEDLRAELRAANRPEATTQRLSQSNVRSNFQSNFQAVNDKVLALRDTVAAIRKEYGRPVIDPRGA